MRPGTKPTPTTLKRAAGNPGKRKLNQHEPKPEGELVEPPEWLTASQKEGWRYAIEHAPQGLLKKLDRAVLMAWVVAEDLYRQAAQEVAKSGLLVPSPNTGVLVQSPYLCIVNKQSQIMLKAGEQLGFSPAARPRIAIEPDEAPSEAPAGEDRGEWNPTGPWHPGCWMPKMT